MGLTKCVHIKFNLDFVPEGFVQFPKLPKLWTWIFQDSELPEVSRTHTQDICQRNLGTTISDDDDDDDGDEGFHHHLCDDVDHHQHHH